MPWGIPVPNDPDHVMYVWFDALVNYISTLGWPNDVATFTQYWPVVQIAGKDNLRQQAAMWQAMLLAAQLPPSKQILINGFISIGGQKMSKSLGNVIAPQEMVERYGTDATRLLLILLGPIANDMDVTWERFDDLYTSVLSNGFGNLCSRIAKLASQINFTKLPGAPSSVTTQNYDEQFLRALLEYDFQTATDWLLSHIQEADHFLSEHKPWLADEATKETLVAQSINQLLTLTFHLEIFMPSVCNQIARHFSQPAISAVPPLFPRLKP